MRVFCINKSLIRNADIASGQCWVGGLRWLATAIIVLLLLAKPVFVAMAAETTQDLVEFSIPRQAVNRALLQFSQDAGVPILFPGGTLSDIESNPIIGRYILEDALEILLVGTDINVVIEAGQLIVRIQEVDESPEDMAGSSSQTKPEKFINRILSTLDSFFLDEPELALTSETQRRESELKEIIVTGSRIRRNEYNNSQPIMVVSNQIMLDLGLINLGDAITMLPSNVSSFSPTTKPGGSETPPYNVNNGLYLANLRGLNPTYGTRTLTLLDSRRHVPSNQGDGVDLNMIPTILVDRVEVVTGGASASYGSGAIGGVVNILLDHDLEGGKLQIDAARTNEGDGSDKHYGLAWGTSFNEKGHLIVGLEAQEMAAIDNCMSTRDWCGRNFALRRNQSYASNKDPYYITREDARTDITNTSLITPSNLTFDPSGTTLSPFEVADELGVGGGGRSIYEYTAIRSNVDRQILFASLDYELNENLNFFLEGSVGDVESYTPQGSIDLRALQIKDDNFYLNQLLTNPCTTAPDECYLHKDFSAQADTANSTITNLKRLVFGFDGRFGFSSWGWDAYFQHGETDVLQAVYDSRHALRMNFAADAVDDGRGNPICRTVRDGAPMNFQGDSKLINGCVPINLFGTTNITSEAFAYTFGRILENTDIEQNIFEAVTSGELPLRIANRPVLAAIGGSWRKESISNIADTLQPDHIRNDYNSQFGESFSGNVEVLEYFTEIDIPIFESLNLQGAVRRSKYRNTAGEGTGVEGETFNYGITAWKLNGNWHPTQWFTLRASHSIDIRAPNFRELYFRKIFAAGSTYGFCNNYWTGESDPCVLDLRGGLELEPEESITSTFGLILNAPRWNLRFAVDYYNINLKDAITPGRTTRVMDYCYYEVDVSFCPKITGTLLDPENPYGGFSKITRVTGEALNLRSYEIEGLDFSTDWITQYPFGTISMRVIASHTVKQLIQISTSSKAFTDIAGVTGYGGGDWEATANWSGQWVTNFEKGPFSLTAQARLVSKGKVYTRILGPQDEAYDPNTKLSADNNRIPSYVVWSLNGAYNMSLLDMDVEWFATIQNLFDKEPPVSGRGIGGTNPAFYDTVGQNYRMGIRAQF